MTLVKLVMRMLRLPLLMCLVLFAWWAVLAHGHAVGTVTTLAGLALSSGSTDGVGAAARFNLPYGVAMDAAGAVAIVVSGEHRGRGGALFC